MPSEEEEEASRKEDVQESASPLPMEGCRPIAVTVAVVVINALRRGTRA